MIWGLDTETDNDGATAWIVQWAIVGDGGVHKGTDVRTLMHCLRRLGRTREKQFIYIHNLKYDLEFIKYAIWELKEEYGAEIDAIFRNGQPIQVKVDVCGRELIFRDSAKKWQGNLRSLGDAIGCPKLENVDPEFKPGWSSQLHLERPEDWQYIIRDARICYLAGRFWHAGGFRSATTSGDAWKDMRRVKGTKFWEEQFPALTYEEDEALRDGYFGGINISRRRGSHFCGSITHDDKISMYPGVMLHKPLPVGKPVYMGSVHPDAGLWVGKLRVKLQLKPGHIPWFTFKNGIDYCGEDIEYGQHAEHCLQWHNLTLTSVDWDNLAIDYDIEVQEGPAEFWAFESRVGLMKPYIDKWGAEKKRAKKGSVEREHAKRMLNAGCGRFALIPDGTQTELVMEDGDLRWRSETVKGEPTAYLPYAMFVTAWGRWDLMARVREVVRQRGIGSVLHCDTDSVIYLGDPIGGYGTEIGEWAMESRPTEIWEGGFKRYIEVVDGKLSVTCAGVPQPKDARGMPYGMQIELLDEPEKIFGGTLGHEHYRIRSEWLRRIYEQYGKDPDDVDTLKLLPRRVPGGVILEGHTHCIDDDALHIRLNRAV